MHRNALENILNAGNDNAMLRYTLGLVCFKEKDFTAAEEHLKMALEHDGRHSASWKLYGKTLSELERYEDAEVTFEKGIENAMSQGDIQAAKEMKVFLKRLHKTA